MSGKITSRISEETLALIRKNKEYFKSQIDVRNDTSKGVDLGVLTKSEDAHTETQLLDNGELQVTFFYPIDNNYEKTDGRLYLIDRYTFDAKDRSKFKFKRKVEYNGRGVDKGRWRALRDIYRNLPEPTPELKKEFAANVAKSYSRPFHADIRKKFKEAYKLENAAFDKFKTEKKALTDAGKDTSTLIDPSYLLGLRYKGWELAELSPKMFHPRSHFTRIERKNGFDIVISWVLEDNDPNTKGFLVVQDRFSFWETDVPTRYDRKILVGHGSPKEEGWEDIRKKFYLEDGKTLRPGVEPSPEAAFQFFGNIKSAVLKEDPNFDAILDDRLKKAEVKTDQASPIDFDSALDQMTEKKFLRGLDEFEPGFRTALDQNKLYFSALQRALGSDYSFEAKEAPVEISVDVHGDKTSVKMVYSFGDPSYDGIERGRVKLTETLQLEGKKLIKIDREVNLEGPDPEGRLQLAHDQIAGQISSGALPDAKSPVAQQFAFTSLLYLAPHLIEIPNQVPVLEMKDVKLPEEKVDQLKALKKIQEDLIALIFHPNVDPKFRGQTLRALLAFQYDDTQSAVQDLNQMITAESQILKDLAPNSPAAKAHQDRAKIGEVLLAISMGHTDMALQMAGQFYSPGLREIFEGALGPLQQRKLNREGLEILSKVALNKVQLKEIDSDRWIGGEDYDADGATKVVNSLFQKASTQVNANGADSPMAVLEQLSDLSEDEKKLRTAILADPIMKELNNIAQETSVEIQAKDYFRMARSRLMDAKLGGAAKWLAQFVAIHKMPLSPSLEGISVIARFSKDRLLVDQKSFLENKLGSSQKMMSVVLNPALAAQMDPTELAALQKQFRDKYSADFTEVEKDLTLLSNRGEFAKLSEADQKAFFDKINKKYGPQMGQLQVIFFSAENLFERTVDAATKNPQKNYKDILLGLKDLSQPEALVRDMIVQDPRFSMIFEASKADSPKALGESYGKVLQSFVADPDLGPTVPKFQEALKQFPFPEERAWQGLYMTKVFFTGYLSDQMYELGMTPVRQKAATEFKAELEAAVKESQQSSDLRANAQATLFAKVQLLAATQPHGNPLDLLKLITDEDLDKELADYKAAFPEPNDDQKKNIAIAEKIYSEMKAERNRLISDPLIQKVAGLSGEENPIKRAQGYKAIFDGITAKPAVIQKLIQVVTHQDPTEKQKLLEDLIKTPDLSAEAISKIQEIAKNQDPEKIQGMMQELGNMPDFKDINYLESSIFLNQRLGMGKLVHISQEDGIKYNDQIKDEDKEKHLAQVPKEALPGQVRKFLAFTEGNGDLGTRMEFYSGAFMHELTKPTTLVAMLAAGYMGPAVEGAGLGLVHRLGLSGRAFTVGSGLATVGGVVTEGFVFGNLHKVGESSFYSAHGQWNNYWGDIGTNILAFGGLRLGHGAVGTFSQKVLATGKMGKWFGGPTIAKDLGAITNPMARVTYPKPRLDGTIGQTTKLGSRITTGLEHTAGVGTMMGTGYLARGLGWAPENKQDWKGNLADTTLMYFQALFGFKLANGMTGGRFSQRIAELRFNNSMLKELPKLGEATPTPLVPELVTTKTLEAYSDRAESFLGKLKDGEAPESVPVVRGDYVKQALENLLSAEVMKHIEVKLENGKVSIRDMRKVIVEDALLIGDGQAEPTKIAVGEWVSIPDGTLLGTAKGKFRFSDGTPSNPTPIEGDPLTYGRLKKLAELPRDEQLSLSRNITKAKDLKDLVERLDKATNDGGLAGDIRWVLMGALPISTLPEPLGVRAKVMELMKAEVQELHRLGFTAERFQLNENPEGLESIQVDYLLGKRAQQLMESIQGAKSLEEVETILKDIPFESLDGVPVSELMADLGAKSKDVSAAGLGQKVRDLKEAEAYQAKEKAGEKNENYANPDTLIHLVKKHIDPQVAENFVDAQSALRRSIDGMDPHAKVLFLKGYIPHFRSKQQKALLDAYFGPEGRRELGSFGRAFEIATMMGRTGLASEVSLVLEKGGDGNYRPVLIRGDVPDGSIPVVVTREISKGKPAKVEEALLSVDEVSQIVETIRPLLDAGATLPQGTVYRGQLKSSEKVNEWRTVLMHPKGGMELIVRAGEEGKIELMIHYSFRWTAKGNAPEVEKALKALRDSSLKDVDLNIHHISKFSDFVNGLETKAGVPTWGEAVSGKIPQLPKKPKWMKIPKIRKGKDAGETKGKSDPPDPKGGKKVDPKDTDSTPPTEGGGSSEALKNGLETTVRQDGANRFSAADLIASIKSWRIFSGWGRTKAEKKTEMPPAEKADKAPDPTEGSQPEGAPKPSTEKGGKKPPPPPKRKKGRAKPPPIPPEARTPRKKAKDTKGPPEPPGKVPEKTQAPHSKVRSMEQREMFEISRKASQRVEERLRDHLRENGDELTEGYEVSFTISASDVTGNFEHSGIMESVTLRYGSVNKWHLSDSSAVNIDSAKQAGNDPTLKAFYEGLLIYKDIGLTVPHNGGI